MVFLTNKPMNVLLKEPVRCKISAFPLEGIRDKQLPSSVVVDIVGNAMSVNDIINLKRLKYIQAPVEMSPGNTVYVVQDVYRNIIELVF